jgi:hypothetical protein
MAGQARRRDGWRVRRRDGWAGEEARCWKSEEMARQGKPEGWEGEKERQLGERGEVTRRGGERLGGKGRLH